MRKLYIDNIRWITVVLVVLYHVIYMFNGIETFGVIGSFSDVQYQDAFQYIVYPWFMLLLFAVSGMSARYELVRRSEKEFIKKRTGKLLVPSTLGLLVFWWILGYYNLLIGGGLEQMAAVPKPVLFIIMAVCGIGPLWYIQMLWIFSVLLIWVRRVEIDRLWKLGEKANVPFLVLFAIVIWGAAQILNTPMVVVYRFGIYGAGFFVGYFVLSHDEVMDRLEKCWLPLAVCAVILEAAFTVLYWGRPYAEHSVLDTPLCSLFAWIAVIAALAFMKKWGDIIKNMTLLSQFSLSFITPLLLCLLICWWMSTSLGIGEWIFIPGFFFGLGGSFTVAYKLYLSVTGHQKKEKKKNKVSFNRHH